MRPLRIAAFAFFALALLALVAAVLLPGDTVPASCEGSAALCGMDTSGLGRLFYGVAAVAVALVGLVLLGLDRLVRKR